MTASAGGPEVLDVATPARLHVVGAGGTGMSTLTGVLAGLGHEMSGSDLVASPALAVLGELGVQVRVGHDPRVVEGVDGVVVSSAVGADNVEVEAAHAASVPVWARRQALAGLFRSRRGIAVSGTHGKTTTTAMLVSVLLAAGWDPTFLVGGDLVRSWPAGWATPGSRTAQVGDLAMLRRRVGAGVGRSPWLVAEADEADGTFLALEAEVAVVTSVGADHLDFFGDVAGVEAAFRRFAARAPLAVVPAEAGWLSERAAGQRTVTVGEDPSAHWRVTVHRRTPVGARFGLTAPARAPVDLKILLPGAHNVADAALAGATALELGVPVHAVAQGLEGFRGVARRFERRGSRRGVVFVDDYAHNPAKVAAAVATAAEGGFTRVVAVFQPHRYSRTATLHSAFAGAFVGADVVVVTDVYAAGERPRAGVTGQLVADAIAGSGQAAPAVYYVPARADLPQVVAELLRPGDCCLALGAGDVGGVIEEILALPGWEA